MKKIILFGDSFGYYEGFPDSVGISWVEYLQNFYNIENHSRIACSLYGQKKIFDKINLANYDKTIFIIPHRIRRFQELNFENRYETDWTLNRAIYLKNTYKENLEYIDVIIKFFTMMYNESDDHVHQLMIDDIIRRCPDVLLLNFDDLIKISDMEFKFFNSKENMYNDKRKCHLCEENNIILGKKIKTAMETNTQVILNLSDFVNPTKNFKFYFN